MNYTLPYFLYPVIAFTIAQGTKFFLKTHRRGRLSWRDIFAYSDMPSGHTATVTSLLAIVYLKLGITSVEFALALVFTAIVITDAIGLRNYLGAHGQALNKIVGDLDDDNVLESHYPKQLERIGHTPLQVLMGAIIGVLVALVGYFWF
ncbi:MAG: divergent PAP2 family protein [Patescibacteria group bacterium]|jgi:acid phosphatase family membrane protein YuiD